MKDVPKRSAADRIAALGPLLVDDFARNLFVGSQRVIADAENPIRLHMFASTVRELFSYTLHYLAPDEELENCDWFEIEEGTDRPTRRQRVLFAIHGGLAKEYVAETLFLDVDKMCSNVVSTIATLNRLTHVRPDTTVTDAAEIENIGERTLLTLADFVELIIDARAAVAEALEEHVHDAAYHAVAGETLPELDELASHYSIEEHEVDEVSVTHISSDSIYLHVTGSVTVGLQWGSNSDVRNDMGAVGERSFPFNAVLRSPVNDPLNVETEDEAPAAVDTSSWWENYYDPEDVFRDLDDEGSDNDNDAKPE